MEKAISKNTLIDNRRKLKYHRVWIPISYYEELKSACIDKESIGDTIHRLYEYHKKTTARKIQPLVMGADGLVPKE